ncbi:MAG: hypothetical protein ACRC4W_02830, partial [Treponemataceae bacterium]
MASCQNVTLPPPEIGGGSSDDQNSSDISSWGPPTNVTATHGLKRRVDLQWRKVRGAAKYAVYGSDNPFSSFVLVVESQSPNVSIQEESGSLKYYKVHAIDAYNNKTDSSRVVIGSSLAVPQITFIEPSNKNGTNEIVVEWLMSNLNTGMGTYEKDSLVYELFYVPKNDPGAKPVAIYPPITDNSISYTVKGLSANTEYLFRVRSYVLFDTIALEDRETSDNFEDSHWVDAETARKMRPDAPENLIASTGMYSDKIVLKWNTPEEIEVSENDRFEKKGLFFKVYRAIVGTNNYTLIDPRFDGLDQMNGFYKKGTILTYEDSFELRNDVAYEYKVQSFGDTDSAPTSNDSIANVTAWKLMPVKTLEVKNNSIGSPASLSFTSPSWSNINSENETDIVFELQAKVTSEFNTAYTNYGDAHINLVFRGGTLVSKDDFEPVTISIPYDINTKYYTFEIKGKYTKESDFFNDFSEISQTTSMLTLTTAVKPDPNFALSIDGYKDSVAFSLTDERNTLAGIQYTIFYKEVGSTDFESKNVTTNIEEGILTFDGLEQGKDYVAKLRADNSGLIVESDIVPFSTLGVPSLETFYASSSYDNINFLWNKVIGAKAYVLEYSYEDGSKTEYRITAENSTNISGVYSASINLADDALNPLKSGKPINVELVVHGNATTKEVSSPVLTNLLGPALTNPKASKAESGKAIEVSWNKVNGAKGYKIYRYKNNTATFDAYYYDLVEKKTYLHGSSRLPDSIVKVENASDIFTLTDIQNPKDFIAGELKDPAQQGQEGSYPFNQSQLAWGNTYTYKIVPLWSSGDKAKYELANVPSDEGYVLGYGQNVVASKGNANTIVHSLDKSLIGEPLSSAEVSTIKVTWDPPKGGETDANYRVWRRQKNDSGTWGEWGNVTSSAILVNYYDDVVDAQGRIYEYLIETVALRDSAKPSYDSDFIEKEAKHGNNRGFLYSPPTVNISRTERPMIEGQYPELVTWTSSSIQGLLTAGINYMVSGYVLESKNLNNSADWLVVADFPLADSEKTASSFNQDITTYG